LRQPAWAGTGHWHVRFAACGLSAEDDQHPARHQCRWAIHQTLIRAPAARARTTSVSKAEIEPDFCCHVSIVMV
jgi:hypothetical protein